MSCARFLAWLFLAMVALPCLAQAPKANGVLLVATAGMGDPRFRETVVLVTQTPEGHTVGVILNRPLRETLSAFVPDARGARRDEPVFYGGPVLERSIVALFRAAEPPPAPAFQVLRGLYLSMHPRAVQPLLDAPGRYARFYAGFSGWAPGQLREEIAQNAWLVLPATEELAFSADPSGMWKELFEKARGFRTRAAAGPHAILKP